MKLTAILILLFSLSGCSGLMSVFSGNASEEIARNESGNVVVNRLGMPVKLKTKRTQAVAISEHSAIALKAVADAEAKKAELRIAEEKNRAPAASCYSLTFDQVTELKADAQAAYLDTADRCMERLQHQQNYAMLAGIIKQLSQGDSDLALVAREYGHTIRAVAAEGTNKVRAFTSFGTAGLVSLNVRKSVESGNNAIRDVGIAGAENAGATTVGDINIAANQSSEGGDGLGGEGIGAFGEAGEGLSEESAALAGAGGIGGTGSGGAGTTSRGDISPINISIGDNNNAAFSTGDSVSQAGLRGSAQFEPNSAGAVNDTSKITNQTPANTIEDATDTVDDKDDVSLLDL